MKRIYKNLDAAMDSANVSVADIAVKLGISRQAVYKKIGDEIRFSLSEAFVIRDMINQKSKKRYSADELFERIGDNE